MIQQLLRLLRPTAKIILDPNALLKRITIGRFHLTGKDRSAVIATVPQYNADQLELLFQEPITRADVLEGKLAPRMKSSVKRRGGKRQTRMKLSLEFAEALHEVLGRAIQDAREKREQKRLTELMVGIMLIQMESKHG